MGLFSSIGKVFKKVLKYAAPVVGIATGNPWLGAAAGALGSAVNGGDVGDTLAGGASGYLSGGNPPFAQTGGNSPSTVLNGDNFSKIAGLLSAYGSYKADKDYDDALNRYNTLVGTGPMAYKFTPEERAAYAGQADTEIGKLSGQRADYIMNNLGSRGMADSGVGISQLSGLANWQDTQRANANGAISQLGWDRGMQTWQGQVQGSLPGVQMAQNDAANAGDAFGAFLTNMGANEAFRLKPRQAPGAPGGVPGYFTGSATKPPNASLNMSSPMARKPWEPYPGYGNTQRPMLASAAYKQF